MKRVKKRQLMIFGMWRKLARLIVARDEMDVNVLHRWRTLVKSMGSQGWLSLGYVAAFSTTDMNNRLREKESKLKSLKIAKRWKDLTYGLLRINQAGGATEKVSSSKPKVMSWNKTKNLISTKIVDPEEKAKAREFEIAGRWNRLTRRLL